MQSIFQTAKSQPAKLLSKPLDRDPVYWLLIIRETNELRYHSSSRHDLESKQYIIAGLLDDDVLVACAVEAARERGG
jgi:hypothetical protein